jgi:hypothetical protein
MPSARSLYFSTRAVCVLGSSLIRRTYLGTWKAAIRLWQNRSKPSRLRRTCSFAVRAGNGQVRPGDTGSLRGRGMVMCVTQAQAGLVSPRWFRL